MAELVKCEGEQFNNLSFETVVFHGDELAAVRVDGIVYVSIRRVCESIGIDYSRQIQKLKLNPLAVVGLMPTTGPDGKKYETAVVDLGQLALWLAGVSLNRVRPEVRNKLYRYQIECKTVLAKHFFGEDFEVVTKPPEPIQASEAVIEAPVVQEPVTAPVKSLAFLAPEALGAYKLARIFGLSGNDALIRTNRVLRQRYDVDVIEELGMTLLLPAPVQEVLLNPTEIGVQVGMTNKAVNKLLIAHGFQVAVEGDPPYKATEKGKPYSKIVDLEIQKQAKGTTYTAKRALRWYETIVPVLKAILAEQTAA